VAGLSRRFFGHRGCREVRTTRTRPPQQRTTREAVMAFSMAGIMAKTPFLRSSLRVRNAARRVFP
jgi:hypothetical protein